MNVFSRVADEQKRIHAGAGVLAMHEREKNQ